MVYLLRSAFPEIIEKADRWMFTRINTGMANPFFDAIMPFARNPPNWAPLYLFLVVFAILNFRSRGLWWTLFLLVTVALCDMTGTYVFKKGFERLRPCNDPDFFMQVRLLADHCSTGFSFVSNHAANHFGIATFFYFTSRKLIGRWALTGFAWAALVSIAQVYIGIHYPFDIIGGAALGVIFGTLIGSFFNNRFGIVIFDKEPTLSS
ncbi:MAG: phosphatase PAP2 family protein [Chitinophagaceae bacterium]|nr:MAG: phosphatase PAP2 family protein [Chitinophagaceae bacterium]